MPRLKTENDVAEWLRGLFGKSNIVYRYESLGPNHDYWNYSDPVKFNRIIYFTPSSNYKSQTGAGKKRWREEGPYVWTLLLEQNGSHTLATVNDGRHHGNHGYAVTFDIRRFDDYDAKQFLVEQACKILRVIKP